MKSVFYTSQARKDLKRIRNDQGKMLKLQKALEMLALGLRLPSSYRMHRLVGQYKGCLECHIEGDLLLVWLDEESDAIEIVRVGSHSEIFGR